MIHNIDNTNCSVTGVQTYLIIVAFGEEQGTQLAVQRCLVGLVAMFGEFVHVGLSELEGLLPQVVLTVAITDMKEPV